MTTRPPLTGNAALASIAILAATACIAVIVIDTAHGGATPLNTHIATALLTAGLACNVGLAANLVATRRRALALAPAWGVVLAWVTTIGKDDPGLLLVGTVPTIAGAATVLWVAQTTTSPRPTPPAPTGALTVAAILATARTLDQAQVNQADAAWRTLWLRGGDRAENRAYKTLDRGDLLHSPGEGFPTLWDALDELSGLTAAGCAAAVAAAAATHDLIDQDDYDTLTRAWRTVVHRHHDAR